MAQEQTARASSRALLVFRGQQLAEKGPAKHKIAIFLTAMSPSPSSLGPVLMMVFLQNRNCFLIAISAATILSSDKANCKECDVRLCAGRGPPMCRAARSASSLVVGRYSRIAPLALNDMLSTTLAITTHSAMPRSKR